MQRSYWMRLGIGVLLCGLLSLAGTQSAEAQAEMQPPPPEEGQVEATGAEPANKNATRLLGGLHLAAAGDYSDPGFGTTLGFFFRADFPFMDYFALTAPMFQMGFIDVSSDFYYTDFNVMPRGRFPLELGGGMLADIYVGVPVGFSFFTATGPGGSSNSEFGYNVGVLFGAQFFFTESIGAMFDIGFHRHDISSLDAPSGVDTGFNGMAVNIGAAFAL